MHGPYPDVDERVRWANLSSLTARRSDRTNHPTWVLIRWELPFYKDGSLAAVRTLGAWTYDQETGIEAGWFTLAFQWLWP